MISVVCPNCDKKIKAPDKYAGKKAKCPGCSSAINIPHAEIEPDFTSPPAFQPHEHIECPFCSEPIKASAKKCKHCGEFLDGSTSNTNIPVHSNSNATTGGSLPGVRVIEATGKKWKLQKIVGGAISLLGISLLIVGGGAQLPGLSAVGVLFATAGIGIIAWSNFWSWWYHG